MSWENHRRVVIKIGSALIADADGVRHAWMQSLAEDVRQLQSEGVEVVLVSSGAVALARQRFNRAEDSLRLEEKQAFAAIGQIALMQHWQQAFGTAQPVAQVLLTAEDSEDRRRYLNARSTIKTLHSLGVLPIVNENDTVATTEIRFGDNDRLAARIAQMIEADLLVLLSDIDGFYTADPRSNADARHIPRVEKLNAEIETMAGGARSASSNGGMITKLQAARIATGSGCSMVITLGAPTNPIRALRDGARATWFTANETPANARKRWLAGTLHASGAVLVDAGAVVALRKGKSLLPAGAKAIVGAFQRGELVDILDEEGCRIAKGLIAYNSDDAQKILGRKSHEIPELVGFQGRAALIHADDIVLL
jgi:glutamate 5-kinase